MNLKRILLRIVLPPFLIGGAGTVWYQNHDSSQAEPYLTAKVQRGDIEDTVAALGTLQPKEYVDVGTQVTGQLKTLHVKIGDHVKRGELVAEIDPALFAAKVETTEAALQNAHAQLSEKLVQQRLAQQQYDRNEELYANKAVSEELLQQSEAAVDQASAQIEQLGAQIRQIQAQLRGDQANLRYTKIFAPISGTVVSINAREGQTLVASQQAPVIMRIADLNTMTAWAQVSEADVPKISLHMPVYFTTLGLPKRRWPGEVKQVLPTPENVNNVILYDVLFDVANHDQVLKPEMSAQTSFVVAKADNVLLVPVSALQASKHRDQGKAGVEKAKKKGKRDKWAVAPTADQAQTATRQYKVRVLGPDGQVEERRVEVGVMSRFKAQVISGLAEGDEVIVGMAQQGGKKKKAKAIIPSQPARP